MDRRSFLRGASRARIRRRRRRGGGRVFEFEPARRERRRTTTSTTEHGPPDWPKLAASLSGTLLLPTDSGYAAAGHLYNSVYTQQAAAIAQCQSAERHPALPLLRPGLRRAGGGASGGHSYAAYSSCPGLVIDVTESGPGLRGRAGRRARAWPPWGRAPSSSTSTASWRHRAGSSRAARVPRWASPAWRWAAGSACSAGPTGSPAISSRRSTS